MDKSLLKPLTGRTMRDALAIVGVFVVSAAVMAELGTPPAWLAPALALSALSIALLCASRVQMLDFAPEVLAGDVIVPRPRRGAGTELKFLLPLQFANAGGAGGIVQWVALRLTIDGDAERSVLLSPVAEVDMQRFIQAKRRLDDENTIDVFTAFPLDGKRSIAKFVLFDIAEKNRSRPLVLRPGRYSFELFVKSTAQRAPKLERVFEHAVEPKQVEEYANDAPLYLIDYPMTLPSARQKMTGAEWLPRAAARYSN